MALLSSVMLDGIVLVTHFLKAVGHGKNGDAHYAVAQVDHRTDC